MDIEVRIHKEDDRGNVYTLLKPIQYCGLTVPEGFESDGASVPRFFWRLVFPPGDAKALFAAIIHDYIYREHPAGWGKNHADKIFFHLLISRGIPYLRAGLAYLGVWLFGGKAWNEGGKA